MAYQEISMHLEHEAWQAVPLGLLWVDLRGWRIEQANPAAAALLGLDEQAVPRALSEGLSAQASVALASSAQDPTAWPSGPMRLHLRADDRVCRAHWLRCRDEGARRLGLLSIELWEPVDAREDAHAQAAAATARHLEDVLEQIIETLSGALAERDPYTVGHQRRVADLALAIGRAMQLAPHRLEALELAALVHDIGQIEIPSEIISRPGPLTPAEMALVQQHPVMGYEILKDVQSPWPLADIVHQHHENLDGSGYPRGLAGDAICLEARILRVCDIIEAMSSHRVYRSSHPMDSVLEEVQRMAGRELVAEVVRIGVALIRREGYAFPA